MEKFTSANTVYMFRRVFGRQGNECCRDLDAGTCIQNFSILGVPVPQFSIFFLKSSLKFHVDFIFSD